MKKILVALILAVQSLLGAEALATPCTMSTLAAYIGLGSGGCTIGNFLFSNFSLLQQPTGSVPFTSVSVTPFASGMTIGLDFGVNATATGNLLLEDLISYRVTGMSGLLNGASLFLTGATATGNGVVTGVENLCIGGLFLGSDGVSMCSGTAVNLGVFDSDPPDSLKFPSSSLLAVVTDIAVDGGVSSALRGFAAATQSLPEPEIMGKVCLMKPGDSGFAECEACQ